METKALKQGMMKLLLEDEDLQNIIIDIFNAKSIEKSRPSCLDMPCAGNGTVAGNGAQSESNPIAKTESDEMEALRKELKSQEQQMAAQSEKIRMLKQDASDGEKKLAAAQQENATLQQQLSHKERNYQEATRKMQEAESSLKRFRASAKNLQQEANRLKKENEEQAKKLSQRFAEGWELFCAYQGISEQSRRLLGGVFVKPDDFTSFICGGAQDRSLEKIWDVIKGCLIQGNTSDADILWDIFEYAVELVNASKTERIYEIMEAKTGTPFDIDLHALSAGSRAHGNIQDVYLLGYKNIYANRVERKSIVKV